MDDHDFAAYMEDCRSLVLEELQRIVPARGGKSGFLYDLVFDYPMREAKALRPSLCTATCRALGGSLEGVVTSATVLELYHNAFLIHDDIEDGSELRRDQPTLHRQHGVPMAINVGDAMLALALRPLLDNMRVLTLGKALRILQIVSEMARESAEGQALELAWIRDGAFARTDRDYIRMVHKKTGHYTFLAPVAVGAVVAGASREQTARLRLFATALGVAFQIQDDVLNLTLEHTSTGKENSGDLWEGKHTLMLLHAVRSASPLDRKRALRILRKPRPGLRTASEKGELRRLVDELWSAHELTRGAHRSLRRALSALERDVPCKTEEDVSFLRELIDHHRSIEHARRVAHRYALRARRSLVEMSFVRPSQHRDFLAKLTDFVVQRDH